MNVGETARRPFVEEVVFLICVVAAVVDFETLSTRRALSGLSKIDNTPHPLYSHTHNPKHLTLARAQALSPTQSLIKPLTSLPCRGFFL